MPKIQGKQIDNDTITQDNLNLSTPLVTDTTSGATVEFVTDYIVSVSGETVIGPPEPGDDNTYTDGIFTDFTDSTPIGTAVDRFNEMFKLLAPAPPSNNWSSVITSIGITSAKKSSYPVGSLTQVTDVIIDPTPSYTVYDTVGTGLSTQTKDGNFNFKLIDYNDAEIVSANIDTNTTTGSVSGNGGTIGYTIADPYTDAGKKGFWEGVTVFSASGTIETAATPSVDTQTISFEHPTVEVKVATFHLDLETHTPSIENLTVGVNSPTMTRYVSGVKGLPTNSKFEGIAFDVVSASSLYYNKPKIWAITGNIAPISEGLIVAPAQNHTENVTGKSVTISDGYLSSVGITVRSYDRFGVEGGTDEYINYNLRIDTNSNETERIITGSGTHPTIGINYDDTESSKSLATVNTTELQLSNKIYKWPSGNYTNYDGGVDYSSVSNGDTTVDGNTWRWATFDAGTIAICNNYFLNITDGNIGTAWDSVKIYVKVVEDGTINTGQFNTGWLDATLNWSVDPSGDGDPTLDIAASESKIKRKLSFGQIAHGGKIIVRIGIKSTDTTYSFKKPTVS